MQLAVPFVTLEIDVAHPAVTDPLEDGPAGLTDLTNGDGLRVRAHAVVRRRQPELASRELGPQGPVRVDQNVVFEMVLVRPLDHLLDEQPVVDRGQPVIRLQQRPSIRHGDCLRAREAGLARSRTPPELGVLRFDHARKPKPVSEALELDSVVR